MAFLAVAEEVVWYRHVGDIQRNNVYGKQKRRGLGYLEAGEAIPRWRGPTVELNPRRSNSTLHIAEARSAGLKVDAAPRHSTAWH